jgi:hypothetical protein
VPNCCFWYSEHAHFWVSHCLLEFKIIEQKIKGLIFISIQPNLLTIITENMLMLSGLLKLFEILPGNDY